ncbi:MAG TPA: cytochrome P450 [Actinomycetota bacterium]|nr:cytochrome P450 [Actinomycetota bacterium]
MTDPTTDQTATTATQEPEGRRRFAFMFGSDPNPYPYYHELRERGRVLQVGENLWLVSGHPEAVRILRDPRISVDARKAPKLQARGRVRGLSREGVGAPSLLRIDAPDHTRLRNLVTKAFSARVVQDLRPSMQEMTDELLDQAHQVGGMEVVGELAYPLPIHVICGMLGVPAEDRELFTSWSDKVARIPSAPDRYKSAAQRRRATVESQAYLQNLIEEHRAEPRDDLLTKLIDVEEQGHLSDDELVSIMILLLIAGHETTVNLITNGIYTMLRNPDQLSLLQDDPSLIVTAVDELLRYESPVQRVSRFSVEDFEIDGKVIPEQDDIVIMLGAANRDPAVFVDPDRLDITREDNRHLAFAAGAHFCLGAALARAEGQIAIGTLLRRYPNATVVEDEVVWRNSAALRGLSTLPIRF